MARWLVPALLAAGAALAVAAASAPAQGRDLGPVVSSRNLSDLHPTIRRRAEQFVEEAWEAGIPVRIVSTYRSLAEQERLYQQGRTTPGPIVTNAPPGGSWHNYGLAFDVALDVDGDPETNDPSWDADSEIWEELGDLGRSLGLRWGGDFGDPGHFEYHPGLTLEQAADGWRPES